MLCCLPVWSSVQFSERKGEYAGRQVGREGGEWAHIEFSTRCGIYSLGTSMQNCWPQATAEMPFFFLVKLFERIRLQVELLCKDCSLVPWLEK